MTTQDNAVPPDRGCYDPARLEPPHWRRSTRALQRIAQSIVGDAAQSEDIVQSAWVRALERGDGRPGTGWLRRLVRHRAIDARRQRAARPIHDAEVDALAGDDASAEEVASRIETQRVLLDAVEGLETPYRVTVYLRYFEALPVREIAARLGVPAKTVESRLTRALAMLRDRLGPRFQDPRTGRWAPALVAFCDPNSLLGAALVSTSASAAPAVGGLASGSGLTFLASVTMKKSAVLALALVLLVTGWFVVDELRPPPNIAATAAIDARDSDRRAVTDLAPVKIDESAERASLTEAETAANEPPPPARLLALSGELRVTVRWPDGDPAPGIAVVAATPWGTGGVRQRLRRVTDARGIAHFAEIPPGPFNLRTDRGSDDDDESVEVVARETAEATIDVLEGLRVAGKVVDTNGSPIADAEIWLSSQTGGWTSGSIIARSDAGGRFHLRDVPAGQSLGALAARHLPSALVDLDLVDVSTQPVAIELLVTRGGGALEGIVSDDEGRPIEDAVVVLGERDGTLDVRFDSTFEEHWHVRYAITGADGRYRLDALETGTAPLRVRRLGLPQWSADVTITAESVTRQDVTLGPGARVTGIVTDSEGAPFPGARLHAFDAPISEAFLQSGQIDYEGAFAQEFAITGADGSYVLEHLPRRTMYLYAMQPRANRRSMDSLSIFTKTEIDLSGEGEHTWDPVLSEGRVISGSVRYRDGAPVTGIFVSVTNSDGGERDHRATYTESGSFKFIQLPSETYDVRAQIWKKPKGAEEPTVSDVVPGGPPIEIVAEFDAPVEYEKGTVSIRFVDTGDRAGGASAVSVSLEDLDRYSWRIGEPEGGVWEFELDSPGKYRAIALFGERLIAVGEPFDYVAGTDMDLGTLVSGPGGTLVLRLERSQEYPPEDVTLSLRHDAYRHGESLDVGNDAVMRLESMQPGAGKITLVGKNLVRVELPYEIRAGEETVLDLSLVPAVGVPYRIDLPAFAEATSVAIRFIDRADGSIVHETSLDDARRYSNPIAWTMQLSPGDYRLEVELGDGRRAETPFTVPSLDPGVAPHPTVTMK